jgi:hypothetical protein
MMFLSDWARSKSAAVAAAVLSRRNVTGSSGAHGPMLRAGPWRSGASGYPNRSSRALTELGVPPPARGCSVP